MTFTSTIADQLDGQVGERCGPADPGVAHQDVQASEGLDQRG
ncbi:hypothetical protein [Actinomadura welshii]|nr:hypothetical protein [Actinomadura madurae]